MEDLSKTRQLSVAVLEDDETVRASIIARLSALPNIHIVADYGSLKEAASVLNLKIDLFFADLNLPDGNSFDLIREVTQRTSAKVVVMSVLEDANSLVTALGMGASGYILKTMPGFELAEVVDSVMDGGAPISPTIARFLLTQYSQPTSLIDKFRPVKRLSKRERQVLTRVASGMSRKEVARDIGISPNTVAEYLKNIYTKYSVTKMAAAVAIAVKNEDIDL